MKGTIPQYLMLILIVCIALFVLLKEDEYFIGSYEKASDNYYILVYTKNGESFYPHFTHWRQVVSFIDNLEKHGKVDYNGYKFSNEEQ